MAIFLVAIITLGLLISWYFHMKKYRDIARLPGPGMLQVMKNMFDNKSAKDVFSALINLNKYYGPVVKLWLNPLKPMLVVSDIKYVEYLLTSNVHLDKSDFYKLLLAYNGTGLGTTSAVIKALKAENFPFLITQHFCQGEVWKLHRKLLTPAFHHKILEEYTQVFEKYWSKLVAELKPKVRQDSVDVFPILENYALRILCETFLEQEDCYISKDYSPARASFYTIITERFLSFVKRNDFLYSFTKTCNREAECVKTMNKFTDKMIQACKTEYLRSTKDDYLKQQRLMGILFEQNFSEADVLSHVNTIIEAGHDTTASTLSFAFFELAKHKDIQDKILEETNSILGMNKSAEITFHDIQRMKYVECVLKEVMRVYVTIPFYDRKFAEDVLMDGVKIPKGTDLSICCYNIHRSPEYFSDPEKFDPDRFAPENVANIPAYAYVPFSAGPRNCIGKTYAMLAMKSAIAKLVRNFELHPVEHELDISTQFVLKSDNGMRIKIKLR